MLAYTRSLDGLRAVAILLVMGVHFHSKVPFGWVGVQLFFVLSGFLITRILSEEKFHAGLTTRWASFISRRARRIVPLYLTYVLLLLLATLLFDAPRAWSQAMPWLLTFSLNLGYVFGGLALDDMYTHFWSLGIEMQVYLFWPLLVWTLSKAALKRAVLLILLLAPLCRWLLAKRGIGPYELYFFTPAQLDAFAAGAAVAVFELGQRPSRAARWLLPSLVCAIVCSVGLGVSANWSAGAKVAPLSAGFPYFMPANGQYAWGYTLLDLTAAIAVLACLHGKLPWLEARWLVFTGRISYGLYVLHRPLLGLLDRYLAPMFASRAMASEARLGVVYLLGSYALAWGSYHFLESRFLRRGKAVIPEEVHAEGPGAVEQQPVAPYG